MSGPECESSALQNLPYLVRASGAKDTTSNPRQNGLHTRGYLPHLKRENADYFVTFRLADSIPFEVIERLLEERTARLRGAKDAEAEAIRLDYQRQIERLLDNNTGACHLRHPAVAGLVAGALRHFDGARYRLGEWVIMPNHTHVLLHPLPGFLLGDIVKSWKQFTARRAWALLGMADDAGTKNRRFWQPESYDHWVRDEMERSRIARYIRNNPVKAGLCKTPEEWRWGSAGAGI